MLCGRNLPGYEGQKVPSPFVQVLQNTHERIQVGCTKAIRNERNPTWDHVFDVHGIRGLKFKFVVFDWFEGDYQAVGCAKWDIAANRLNEPTWLHVSRDGEIKVNVEEIANAKPVTAPNAGQSLQRNLVIYGNLAFAPAGESRSCPLDVSLIAFSRTGLVSELCLNCKKTLNGKCRHSGSVMCRCYDTYGPSIRLDLTALFGGLDPVQAVVIAVTSNYASKPLSDYQWIAVDFYTTGETMCNRTRDGCLNAMDVRLQLPHFYRRVPLSPIPGSLACVVGLMFHDQRGLSFQNVVWNAPSQICQLEPLTICEFAPELSSLAGFPCNPHVQRRFCAAPKLTVSLRRCLSTIGIQGVPPISIMASWDGECEMNMSAVAIDESFKKATAVYFGKLLAFNGALTHAGDQEGCDHLERITVVLPKLPPVVKYICVSLNVPNREGIGALGRCVLRLVNDHIELFYHEFKKKLGMNGLLSMVFQRAKNDWNVIPLLVPSTHSEINGMREFLMNAMKEMFQTPRS